MRRTIILLLAAGTLFVGSKSFAGDVLEVERLANPMVGAGEIGTEKFGIEENAFGEAGVVNLEQLSDLRGREGGMSVTVATDQDLNAAVVGGAITADNFTTGGVSFGENAFDNFGGVGLVNVVTGNNNAVEAAIGVTFNLLD